MFVWEGKTAVVTGASAGIGAAILVDLAKLGVNVIGLARRKDRVEALAAANKGLKGKIQAFECDVSCPKSIQATFDLIEKTVGTIHVWINNAGTWTSNKLTSDALKDEDIIGTINTNFTGLALCSRKAVKLMEKNGEEGFIINIGSLAGQISASSAQANFGTNVYAGTKHAVKNLTDVLRLELLGKKDNKIRVAHVSPGVVKSDFAVASGLPQAALDAVPGLTSKEVSDAVIYILGTPLNVNVTEVTIMPRGQLS